MGRWGGEEDGEAEEGRGGRRRWRGKGVSISIRLLRDHRELGIYQKAFEAAMDIFQLSKKFPVEERYSLTLKDDKALQGYM